MRRLSTFLAVVLALAAIPSAGTAQVAPDTAELMRVELAVAEHVRERRLLGQITAEIVFHPGQHHGPHATAVVPSYRTDAHQERLARVMGARLIGEPDPVREEFRIGVPVIDGETARVWLMSSHPQQEGLAGVSQYDELYLFVRSGGAWKYSRRLMQRST